MIKMIFCCPNC